LTLTFIFKIRIVYIPVHFLETRMRNKYISAFLCLGMGILYIAVPHTLLPVCEYAETAMGGHAAIASPMGHSTQSHMACFWTARAELGLGMLIIFGGLLPALSNSIEQRLGITLMFAASSVLGAAIPAVLIGVCPGETMPCRAGTLPALLILSGLFFLFSLLNVLFLNKRRKAGGNG
jgi:hypothetical protein